MKAIESYIASVGGLATTAQLLAGKHEWEWLRSASTYGSRIIRVRKGWWATHLTHPALIDARRAGGRLSCVSALQVWSGHDYDDREPLHIEVERNSSRRRSQLPPDRCIVVHRPAHRSRGGQTTVSYSAAAHQAARCTARAALHTLHCRRCNPQADVMSAAAR